MQQDVVTLWVKPPLLVKLSPPRQMSELYASWHYWRIYRIDAIHELDIQRFEDVLK